MTATATTTNPGLSEVEAAVRAVLAPLLASRPSVASKVPTRVREAGVEDFAGRLLSARLAESYGPGVRVVRVAPGTVVTPLARDHLRRQGIEVRLASAAEILGAGRIGDWGFAIDSRAGLIEVVRRLWLDGPDAWREVPGGAEAATDWVASGSDRGILVLTDDAPLVVYRACRRDGVRAAAAFDVETAVRAVRSLGANLLAVEPSGKPVGLIRQIGATFRRGGAPVAPAGLEAWGGGAA